MAKHFLTLEILTSIKRSTQENNQTRLLLQRPRTRYIVTFENDYNKYIQANKKLFIFCVITEQIVYFLFIFLFIQYQLHIQLVYKKTHTGDYDSLDMCG